MSIFAISDLHLSFVHNRTMNQFGAQWENHANKIRNNWIDIVSEDDCVIVPGDISWASKTVDALPDLEFINKLPGRKILVKGNHDQWWGSVSQLEQMFPAMIFIKNNCCFYEDYAICGTRGWLCPNDTYFDKSSHERPYRREVARLKRSLDYSITHGAKKIIAVMHYAPTNDKKEPSGFTDLLNNPAYPITHLIYGHLHGVDSFHVSLHGQVNDILYHLVSCDYLDFTPLRIV